MVSNVGLNYSNTGMQYQNSWSGYSMPNLTGSIFGNGLQPIDTNYENDILMPDFLKTTSPTYNVNLQSQAQQIASNQTIQNKNVSSQYQPTDMNAVRAQLADANNYQLERQNQVNEYLQNQNPNIKTTENGGVYASTSAGKKLGLTAGILYPVLTTASKGLKAFATKGFLCKLPIFAVGGYILGSLADGFINSKRAQNA